MMNKLLKCVLCGVTLLTLWFTTPEAQAQRRGGRGYGVQAGPGGVYVGPSYGGRYYGGWDGRYYGDRYYGDRYYSPYRYSYYPRSYYYYPGAYQYSYPTTTYEYPTTTYESYYPATTATSTARIHVHVPDANAEVWFNGTATRQRGMDREFVTPSLSSGVRHSYEVRARWVDASGQTVERTRTVDVEAGGEAHVDFRG